MPPNDPVLTVAQMQAAERAHREEAGRLERALAEMERAKAYSEMQLRAELQRQHQEHEQEAAALEDKVSRLLTQRRWRLEAYLDLQNAYNRRIPEPIINGIDDQETIYGFGLPILPILGLKGVLWP